LKNKRKIPVMDGMEVFRNKQEFIRTGKKNNDILLGKIERKIYVWCFVGMVVEKFNADAIIF
jgi:hypothetical protein